jgi:hypothetical protein
MAVTALPRTRTRATHQVARLSPVVLLLTLVAPALDFLAAVQPGVAVPLIGLLAAGAASAALLGAWLRFPRSSTLAAATLAACSSLGMRLVGADVAPLLSLLAVLALGVGGAFASPRDDAEAWLAS